jgi:ABC-type arginine transport system ATPase subunit
MSDDIDPAMDLKGIELLTGVAQTVQGMEFSCPWGKEVVTSGGKGTGHE